MPNKLLDLVQDKYVLPLYIYDLSCPTKNGEETLDIDLYPNQIFSKVPIGRGDRIVLRSKDGDIGKALAFEVKYVEHDTHVDATARNWLCLNPIWSLP